jgi:hypothetical protein
MWPMNAAMIDNKPSSATLIASQTSDDEVGAVLAGEL